MLPQDQPTPATRLLWISSQGDSIPIHLSHFSGWERGIGMLAPGMTRYST